ncbi:MAG: hypothetical protein J2P27_15060 [Actinobacteria bacterium]|nr:hypothetical protein [Actinomycetota bacterium]
MGFLDALLGRTKPVPPNLDELFALPGAALTLQAGTDFKATGSGSVCFRAAEGKAFSDIEKDVQDLLNMGNDSKPVEVSTDRYQFTWLVLRHSPDDPEGLVTNLHAVNSSLELGGFGPQLLCTLMSFRNSAGQSLGLVYLYKRGTFYPFAPVSGESRNNALELQIRGVLGADLKIEPDLGRWMPIWGAPGL